MQFIFFPYDNLHFTQQVLGGNSVLELSNEEMHLN